MKIGKREAKLERCKKYYLMIIVVLIYSAFADSGVQYDWSGGPGTNGPLSSWGDEFSNSVFVDWASQSGSIVLDKTGSFTMIKQVYGLMWTKPCHLSNDEFTDVFVRSNSTDNACWYIQGAGGAEWYKRSVSATDNIADISTCDIDDDTHIDIFASVNNGTFDGFIWYERLNATGDQWQVHQISSETSTGHVFAADMDNDNDYDLIGLFGGSSSDDQNIAWWENQNGGSSWLKHSISVGPDSRYLSSLDVADCNNDGDLDIVCGSLSDSVYLFEQISADLWNLHSISYGSDGELMQARFSDIDSDGLLDIVTCPFYTYNSDVLWLRNSGVMSSWLPFVINTETDKAIEAFPGDVDGDGDADITVVGSPGYPLKEVFWLENISPLSGDWISHMAFEDSSGTYFESADVNSDGLTDLVCSYRFSSSSASNYTGWWNLRAGYASESAQLESSILYINDVEWGNIDWSAVTPAGTSVAFQLRASDDASNMGDWSAEITSPGSIATYLNNGDSYVQYRAILSSTDASLTPTLNNVVLTWTTTGIEGSEESEEITLDVVSNPNPGSALLSLSLPSSYEVQLDVFDTAGRVQHRVISGCVSAGQTMVQLDRLPPGIYICRLQANGITVTDQFTVIGN